MRTAVKNRPRWARILLRSLWCLTAMTYMAHLALWVQVNAVGPVFMMHIGPSSDLLIPSIVALVAAGGAAAMTFTLGVVIDARGFTEKAGLALLGTMVAAGTCYITWFAMLTTTLLGWYTWPRWFF